MLSGILTFSLSVFPDELKTDSIHRKKLGEVIVNGQQLQILRASMPLQIISGSELDKLNAYNVSDIAKYFSGVTVKDYGGIGGMKTVSLRGMGAQYTGVSYDGMIMSDIQSGQIDLGRFSLGNISGIELSNGQPNDIFQTARAFSSGGLLNLSSILPENNENQNITGKVSLITGSFGLINPNLFLGKNLGRKLYINISTDALTANGKYKFTQYYGSKDNLSEVLTRTNCDIQSIRTEMNIHYNLHDKEIISLKTNYFGSERGLPDGITFYNSYNTERLLDRNLLSQIHYENKTSQKFQYQLFGKYNSAYNKYNETDSKYTNGLLNEEYTQKEYYLSSCFLLHPLEPLFLSVSADWWYNDLNIVSNSTFENFVYPTRNTGLVNIATKYVTDRLTLSGNLLYTSTRERVRTGSASPDRNKLSPTLSLAYKLLDNKDLRIRAFYKNIYRLPTFNDLYYQDLGNHNLRPENANQFNIGFTYLETEIPFLSDFSVSADGYYNRVKDKIIAVPKDLFHWTMVNKGMVDIIGVDINVKTGIYLTKSEQINILGNYSYNKSTDVTPLSANYGEQIPYTPFYSGSGSISYQHKNWEAGYNILYSGLRWTGQNITANKIDAYMIHSVFATGIYKKYSLKVELINLLNTQYEVVKFYPMPGLNFRITLNMKI